MYWRVIKGAFGELPLVQMDGSSLAVTGKLLFGYGTWPLDAVFGH